MTLARCCGTCVSLSLNIDPPGSPVAERDQPIMNSKNVIELIRILYFYFFSTNKRMTGNQYVKIFKMYCNVIYLKVTDWCDNNVYRMISYLLLQ